ncbi:MAG TPA: LamG-like jellyroll fold domain-containing protein [Verrucomicrobiae bacterium]|nr:LamG-like jellyroll fold domain-containing protein [Verrucomicrobiae bacterium]
MKKRDLSAGAASNLLRSRFTFARISLLLLLPTVALAAETHVLSGTVPKAVTQSNLQPVGRLPGTKQLHLAIGLPLRNQAELDALLQQIGDPTSPSFRHYLTPEQFAERFGPTEKDYDTLVTFATSHGFTVTTRHPNRSLLSVTASVADIEKTLNVKMREYQHPTEARAFYAPDVEPSVPAGISVLGISGLSDFSRPRPRLQVLPPGQQAPQPNSGSGPGGLYMGNDFRAAYVPDSPLTGTGQTVGLLQFDGYTAGDITYYENLNGLPNVPLVNVLLDGFGGGPSGFGGEVEVSLDIEMAISMAPGLSKVIVYMAGPYGNWHDILNRITTDNLAKQISCSWYQPGAPKDPIADGIFQQMAAQGQSFFDASGDYDAFTGLIPFLGDTPYVTQVGGTTLTTTGPGGAYVSETAWNRGNGIGTGGGISTQYPIPSWQSNVDMTANHGSTTMRNIPDVALTAENVYVRANGTTYSVGGTSCAAPLWAGFLALVNQQAAAQGSAPVGFLNPTVYTLGLGSRYATSLHDTITGNNFSSGSPTNFPAVVGYDLCTGWGTPSGVNTINALLSPNVNPVLTVVATTVTGGNGNGAIDPDECNFLSVSIQNSGNGTAAVVNATLSTTTPGVTILQPKSAWPNLVPNAIGSNTIPFQITTSPSFVCGAPVALSLAVTFNQGSSTLNYTIPSSSVYAITQTNGASIVPGVADTGNHCDDCCTTIALPFAYLFYGQSYTNVTLSSNGNLQFAGSNATPKNVCLPSFGFDQSIFPQWQDLRTDGAGNGVFTSTTGVAPNRIFNIEWRAVYYSGGVSTSTVNFEVCLYENQGRFDIIYGNLNGNGNGATVGVQNNTNAVSQFECSSGVLANGLQVTFQVLPCPDGGGQCQTGLLGYWTFDEGAGSTANDSSGNMNTGAITNMVGNPLSWVGGVFGGALDFDHQTQVIVSNSLSLNPFSGITISAWMDADYWGNSGYTPRILEKGNSDNQYELLSTSSGQLEFLLPGVSNGVLVANAPSPGSWHQVAGTFNGSSMILYLDGQVAAQQPASGVLAITSDRLAIGSDPAGSVSNMFSGRMDDVRVYGRALSAAEIAQLYNADTVGDGIPNWWRQQYFGTGSTTGSTTCATCDFDGTGQNNLFKYTAGLDPTNPSSAFGLNVALFSTNFTVIGGLVANYQFDGNLTNDASGNGHNGIAAGGVTLTKDRFGNSNSAMHCDGATGYVRVPAQLTGGNPFTWSIWFRPGFTATNLTGALLNEGGAPAQGQTSPALWINFISPPTFNPGVIDFYYYGSSGGVHLLSQTRAQWDSNAWYHVAVTSDSSGNRCMYVNGVCEGSANGQEFGQGNGNFYMGALASYSQNYFLGDIDDVRVYNRALSAQEIQQLYFGASSTQANVQFSPVLPKHTYTPQFSTALVSGVWLPLTTFTGPVTNGNQVTITDTSATQPAKFYRIDISKP